MVTIKQRQSTANHGSMTEISYFKLNPRNSGFIEAYCQDPPKSSQICSLCHNLRQKQSLWKDVPLSMYRILPKTGRQYWKHCTKEGILSTTSHDMINNLWRCSRLSDSSSLMLIKGAYHCPLLRPFCD